ncbi:MAG: dethiobiotin synthase [Candidatus Obscuribacterales bacterium]|jgi:dethiobiotin synthetase
MSTAPTQTTAKGKQASQGLTIIGTEAGCGKTVFMTGLSALLRQQGIDVRAVKPIVLGTKERAESEISFICSISGTPRNYPASIISSAKNLSEAQWEQSLSVGLAASQFTFVETPGGCASPMSFEQNSVGTLAHSWKDTRDFARELGYPCIIVAHHNHEAIEKLVLAYSYMQELPITGMVTVETVANEGKVLESKLTRTEVALLLASRTTAPYLGCLKFSPSISVPRVNQGNLIKVISEGVDLLLILKSLNIAVVK